MDRQVDAAPGTQWGVVVVVEKSWKGEGFEL